MVPTAALIPAYNSAATVGDVVSGSLRALSAVLVVDDGSDDGTGAAAAQAGADVIRHPTNRGKGAALLTGFRHLAERGFARAVTLDADGQHPPEEIATLLAASDADPQALVIGVRKKEGQHIAASNRLANRLADLAVSWIARRRLLDTQSGFRVYPIAPTLALGAQSPRFEFETEIIIRAAQAGIAVREVGTQVHYPPPAVRQSHFRRVADTARTVAVVLSAALHRIGVRR